MESTGCKPERLAVWRHTCCVSDRLSRVQTSSRNRRRQRVAKLFERHAIRRSGSVESRAFSAHLTLAIPTIPAIIVALRILIVSGGGYATLLALLQNINVVAILIGTFIPLLGSVGCMLCIAYIGHRGSQATTAFEKREARRSTLRVLPLALACVLLVVGTLTETIILVAFTSLFFSVYTLLRLTRRKDQQHRDRLGERFPMYSRFTHLANKSLSPAPRILPKAWIAVGILIMATPIISKRYVASR